jgi:hypothetical protein
VTNVNPAPPTPYVTVKASVASGCGRVTVIPLLWFYPSGPEVSVPNGSLVVLRAYPCEGCRLQYWEVSDSLRTWFEYGTSVGFKVNRSVTALAYFTEQPEVPKLALRAETVDKEPVYANMSGWVFWVDYSNVVHNTTLSNATFYRLEYTLNQWKPIGFKVATNGTASWVGVRAVWYGSYALSLDYWNTASGCTYVTWDSGSYSTISGLHLLFVQAKGSGAYVYTKSGWLNVESCSVMQGAGQTRSVSGWCVYTGTYNFNNAKPEVNESVCGWISGTYSVARKAQLKFLRWELRAPNGTLLLAWPGPEVYLPVWYDNKAYKWRGVMPPTTDDTYELVAIYGPPDASRLFTVKVYATLPDGSRVALPPLKINATTFGAAASTAINGSGVSQLTLPLGGSVRLSFPRVVEQPPFRLVVENATFNGKRFASMVFEGATVSVTIPSFNESGTVEVWYRVVAPLTVYWGPGGSVTPDFRQVANGTVLYSEDGMPFILAISPESGYNFSRWLFVGKPWLGQPKMVSGAPSSSILWVNDTYLGSWSVTATFSFKPLYSSIATNVELYVEAVGANGTVRPLLRKYARYQGTTAQQTVTLTWTGELYRERVRLRLVSYQDASFSVTGSPSIPAPPPPPSGPLVSISLMQASVTPASYSFARENVTATENAVWLETYSRRRYEGSVRIAVNASVSNILSQYKWLKVVAVDAAGREGELVSVYRNGSQGSSVSVAWEGVLNDEYVKFNVGNSQSRLTEALSAFVEPLLPANATVLYRWPVQLKAEFTQG